MKKISQKKLLFFQKINTIKKKIFKSWIKKKIFKSWIKKYINLSICIKIVIFIY